MTRAGAFLFVYGTLRPCIRIEAAEWLAQAGEHLGAASTAGRLYDLGAHPALVAGPHGRERVRGDLYRLARPREVFEWLDPYEAAPLGRGGPRFLRVARTVHGERRGRATAWVYVYRRPVLGARRIPSGDYARHLGIETLPAMSSATSAE